MNCNVCYDGCTIIWDTDCVIYTGPDLENIDVATDDTLTEILEKLELLDFTETAFSANGTNSIYAIAGGTSGHSPSYHVRLNPSEDNLITVSSAGLFVDKNSGGDGKVKVDEDDPKAYLEDQFGASADDDDILTVTPTKEDGKIKFVPTLSIENLLGVIDTSYHDEFCEIIDGCIIHSGCTCKTYRLMWGHSSGIVPEFIYFSYTDCEDGPVTQRLNVGETVEFCACEGAVTYPDISGLVLLEQGDC